MLCPEIATNDVMSLMREMLMSVRDINRRIDEISTGMKNNWYNPDKFDEMAKRHERLRNTKYCIVESIYSIRHDSCFRDFSQEKFFKKILEL